MLRHPVAVAFLLAALSVVTSAGCNEVKAATQAEEHVDVLVVLQSPDAGARAPASRDALTRRSQQVESLRESAAASQQNLRSWLAARSYPHRSFWIINAIAARVPRAELDALTRRPDVLRVVADAPARVELPRPEPADEATNGRAPSAVEWGVQRIRAPEVWALGYTGQGVVIGGQDTGYDWDHPALRDQYRGWNGATADHNYSWHDAIHASDWPGQSNPCGFDSLEPCDDDSHGTHTMGSMVGDDGGSNQVGVAPGARWIGCRNMQQGDGRPSTYIECFQWLVAPTDLAGENPNPAMAADVINNSWGCPPSEGCNAGLTATMQSVVSNVRDAGIVVVASAGNSGSSCSTIVDPPSIFLESFTVGATNSSDAIAGFSSRGPTPAGLLKPDVVAPGVSIRSSVPGGYSAFSGTSMAGPHVAGAVALLISADPTLRGDPDAIQATLESTAMPITTTQNCGIFPGNSVPNAVFGRGLIDVRAAVAARMPMFVSGFE